MSGEKGEEEKEKWEKRSGKSTSDGEVGANCRLKDHDK